MKNPAIEIKKTPEDESGSKKEYLFRNISIWIDDYNDIFSDFDPRDFSERNISDDFLAEVNKVSRESDFLVDELRLLIPEKARQTESESIIVKRLHSHFRKSCLFYSVQLKVQNKKGILFSVTGVIMMMVASYISSQQSDSLFMHSILIVLEPAGWFLVWTGLDLLFHSSKEKKPELDFYNKLTKSKIVFVSI